jgi:Arylsulfotransferase (ASST)/Carboxypeptidase regulatory-like domain
MKKRQLILVILMLITVFIYGQEAFEGYTLYNPNGSRNAYLLDMEGDTVHSWYSSSNGGYSCYLLEDGSLLRPLEANNTQLQGGASSGRFGRFSWDDDTLWQYDYHGTDYLPHHDIEPLPNGNFLAIVWEVKSGTECVNNGRDSYISLWPDYIVEIQPVGTNDAEIVWEWHFWDHLIQDHDSSKLNYGVVEDHPELLDINLGGAGGGPGGGGGDWLHINGIDYNEELDQIVVSSHNLDEIYVIDHSTTTEEAASHSGGNSGMGGDILYRWGYADNYGGNGSYEFNVVHCAYWVPADCPGAGNLMAFNNEMSNNQSQIVEIEPPYENTYNYSWTPGTAYAPDEPVWEYSNGTSFYSNHLGSVQRLPNGNTLISESTSGYMFEVDVDGNVMWEKDITNEVARCLRYGMDYPGLSALFPSATVNGFVQDIESFEAVVDATVSVGEYEVTTDETGYYEFVIAADTYELTCEHPDFEDYIHPDDFILVENDVITINISMTPLVQYGTISGTVSDANNASLIADAVISIGEYEAETGMDGSFSLILPAGTYTLACEHAGYEDYTYPENIILAGNDEIEFDIELIPVSGNDIDQISNSSILLGNYPNPFNPVTTISFVIADDTANTELSIYNLKGEKINTLIDRQMAIGLNSVIWDGNDSFDNAVPSGCFFYRLINGNHVSTRKMILLK